MRFQAALVAGAMTVVLAAGIPEARADYIFSGSGTSGNFTGQASEPWSTDYTIGQLHNWGSPGVGAGVTQYLETDQAFGMDLTFSGAGPIDSASIAIGNGASCQGTTTGGTTFCTTSPDEDIWTAFLTGPDSISFRAQDPSFFLSTDDYYFVNVFFDGDTAPTSFTGAWVTSFAPNPSGVPEPATLSLFGAGLAGLAIIRRRRKRARQV